MHEDHEDLDGRRASQCSLWPIHASPYLPSNLPDGTPACLHGIAVESDGESGSIIACRIESRLGREILFFLFIRCYSICRT